MNNLLEIYTDASYSKKHNIGISGFLIINKSTSILKTLSLKNNNINRLEFYSAIFAIRMIKKLKLSNKKIIIYTDSNTLAKILDRKAKLIKNSFNSKNKNTILKNADIYKKFYKEIDGLDLRIIWIKGHKKETLKDKTDINFSKIDKLVRKKLRKTILK